MKRTTIFIDEEIESELKALAGRRGRPVAAVVREALARHVAEEKARYAPSLSFVAIGRSGHRDTAERHEEILWKGLRRHARPRRRRAKR